LPKTKLECAENGRGVQKSQKGKGGNSVRAGVWISARGRGRSTKELKERGGKDD